MIASVLVATAVSFVVTFSGPPPFEPPRSLRSIARVLTGQPPVPFFGGPRSGQPGPQGRAPFPRGDERPMFMRRFEPLERVRQATPPRRRDGETADRAIATRLAAELKVPVTDVLAFTTATSKPCSISSRR